jgi:hypothetical protein
MGISELQIINDRDRFVSRSLQAVRVRRFLMAGFAILGRAMSNRETIDAAAAPAYVVPRPPDFYRGPGEHVTGNTFNAIFAAMSSPDGQEPEAVSILFTEANTPEPEARELHGIGIWLVKPRRIARAGVQACFGHSCNTLYVMSHWDDRGPMRLTEPVAGRAAEYLGARRAEIEKQGYPQCRRALRLFVESFERKGIP